MKKILLSTLALIFAIHSFSQTRTEIKTADLSKGISSYIARNFSDYKIDRVFRVDSKGVISTEVMISKGNDRWSLTFDKNLKLIRKLSLRPMGKAIPASEKNKTSQPAKK